jgi:hypothetical protein
MFVNLKRANARIAELEEELQTSEEILGAAQVNEERILLFETEKAELETENKALKVASDLLEAEAKAAATVATEAEAQVEALKSEAQTAEAQAADLVASQGVESEDAPPAVEESAKSSDEIQTIFRSMSNGLERSAFYQKHRSALLS